MNRARFIPIASLLIVLGAAMAGGASLLTWARATWKNDLQGQFDTTATGGDAAQALIPLAVAALAALGAVLASRGWLRRVVGVLIALAGATVMWQGIAGLVSAPTDALTPTGRPATEVGTANLEFWGPAIASLGGLLLITAGVLVVLAPSAKRAMGSRYERGPVAVGPGDSARDADLDAVAMWKEQDAARDPTLADSVAPPSGISQVPPNGSTFDAVKFTDEPPTDGVANRPAGER